MFARRDTQMALYKMVVTMTDKPVINIWVWQGKEKEF